MLADESIMIFDGEFEKKNCFPLFMFLIEQPQIEPNFYI